MRPVLEVSACPRKLEQTSNLSEKNGCRHFLALDSPPGGLLHFSNSMEYVRESMRFKNSASSEKDGERSDVGGERPEFPTRLC